MTIVAKQQGASVLHILPWQYYIGLNCDPRDSDSGTGLCKDSCTLDFTAPHPPRRLERQALRINPGEHLPLPTGITASQSSCWSTECLGGIAFWAF